MKKSRIFDIITIVFLLVFIVSSVNVLIITYNYRKSNSTYNDLQESFVTTDNVYYNPTDLEDDTPTLIPELSVPIAVDFSSLLKENEDIVGWIYCPNTPINYPVVQGEDNDEYLRRGLDKKYLFSGTIFVDYRNTQIGEDINYLIYGHNMKNDTMFSTLTKYKNQEYFENHEKIYYLTPEKNYFIQLHAGVVVNSDDKIYDTSLSKSEFREYLRQLREKSEFHSGLPIRDDDIVVTLSTCSYEFDNARHIVIGTLHETQDF